ncbi:RnfABCDGE type electron transport complex subunit D [Shigella flexneri]
MFTTNRGRVDFRRAGGPATYGLFAALGGYPDSMAFAVLLANVTVPLIDYYTRPRVYGHR